MKKQKIICLEGMVGAGKTTQLEKLQKFLSPNSYLIQELNQFSPLKEEIGRWKEKARYNNYKHQKEDIIKLAKARAETQKRLIKLTEKVEYILMERGIYTSMVFESNPISMDEIKEINLKEGVIIPDQCIVLACDSKVALKRIDKRRINYGKYTSRAYHENLKRIREVKELYRKLIIGNSQIKIINSLGSPQETFLKILEGLEL